MRIFENYTEEQIYKAFPEKEAVDAFDTPLLYNKIYYTTGGKLVGLFDKYVNAWQSKFICVVADKKTEEERLLKAWEHLREREDSYKDASAILSDEEIDILKGVKR